MDQIVKGDYLILCQTKKKKKKVLIVEGKTIYVPTNKTILVRSKANVHVLIKMYLIYKVIATGKL